MLSTRFLFLSTVVSHCASIILMKTRWRAHKAAAVRAHRQASPELRAREARLQRRPGNGSRISLPYTATTKIVLCAHLVSLHDDRVGKMGAIRGFPDYFRSFAHSSLFTSWICEDLFRRGRGALVGCPKKRSYIICPK